MPSVRPTGCASELPGPGREVTNRTPSAASEVFAGDSRQTFRKPAAALPKFELPVGRGTAGARQCSACEVCGRGVPPPPPKFELWLGRRMPRQSL